MLTNQYMCGRCACNHITKTFSNAKSANSVYLSLSSTAEGHGQCPCIKMYIHYAVGLKIQQNRDTMASRWLNPNRVHISAHNSHAISIMMTNDDTF